MKKKTKYTIIRFIGLFIAYILIRFLLHYLFEDLSTLYIRIISFVLATLLVPKIKTYESQMGTQLQLKWFFWKKPVSL
ncbi:hypothetical protein CLV91_3239 [Maribacter vaceletii]|uniref:Uncharacterized protein n=1 Tax=Maribacter vaceletii TaxID=1206816 RepID=A0A495DS72_9FLAO|nr:hypothetical protein CLV91_3239 [Maribacter vaceletii]